MLVCHVLQCTSGLHVALCAFAPSTSFIVNIVPRGSIDTTVMEAGSPKL